MITLLCGMLSLITNTKKSVLDNILFSLQFTIHSKRQYTIQHNLKYQATNFACHERKFGSAIKLIIIKPVHEVRFIHIRLSSGVWRTRKSFNCKPDLFESLFCLVHSLWV